MGIKRANDFAHCLDSLTVQCAARFNAICSTVTIQKAKKRMVLAWTCQMRLLLSSSHSSDCNLTCLPSSVLLPHIVDLDHRQRQPELETLRFKPAVTVPTQHLLLWLLATKGKNDS